MTDLFQQYNIMQYFQDRSNEERENQINIINNIVSQEFLEKERQKGKVTAFETLTNAKKWGYAVPYIGTGASIGESFKIKHLQNKVKDGVQLTPEEMETYKEFVLDIASLSARGQTIPAMAFDGFLQSLPYTVEMGVGLVSSAEGVGLASLGQTGSKLAVKQALKQGVVKTTKEAVKKKLATTTAKTLLKDSTIGVGKFNLKYVPQQGIKRFGEIEVDNNLMLTPEGQVLLNEAETNPAISALKAMALTHIETFSETAGYAFSAGGNILGKYINSKVLNKLPKSFSKNFEKLAKQVTGLTAFKALEKYGFNGLLEEYGEERVGDLLKVTFNLDDDEGYSFEQFLNAIFPPKEQAIAELLSFAMMGGAGVGIKKTADFAKYKTIANNIKDQSLNKDGTYNFDKMKRLIKKNNPSISATNLDKAVESVKNGISKTKDYSVDDFLLDCGVFRLHAKKSNTDERLTEILQANGMKDEDIEEVLDFSSLDEKAYLLKMHDEATQKPQEDYSEIKEGLVKSGRTEEQAGMEISTLNKIDEVLLDKYNDEGEAENLIKNRNLKLNIDKLKENNTSNDFESVVEKAKQHTIKTGEQTEVKKDKDGNYSYEVSNSDEIETDNSAEKNSDEVLETFTAENTQEFAPEEKPAPIDKYEDYGEKIHGAKKDLWQSYQDILNKPLSDNFEKMSLSKDFPEPNYEMLIREGVSTDILAAIKALRDTIPTKPRGTQGTHARQQWIDAIKACRTLASELIKGDIKQDRLIEVLQKNEFRGFKEKVDLYVELGYPAFKNANGWKITIGSYTVANGVRFDSPKTMFSAYNVTKTKGIKHFDAYDTREELINALREKLSTEPEKQEKKTKLDIYQVRKTGEIIIGKKVGTNKWIDLKGGFTTSKEAREYYKEHEAELLEQLKKRKETPETRHTANRDRVGEDYREGMNITPEKFASEFGFRGVQFGNYVEQAKRVDDINEAYDALLDLANLLDVPTRALSLNGSLGIAFGARGNGGKFPAKAHYEPAEIVINLTKKKGAGSLAHEWWHALDNYFGKKDGSEFGYITEKNNAQNTRKEVLEAFKNIAKVVSKNMYGRSAKIDSSRSKDYWSTTVEMTARAFEAYIIGKAKLKGFTNDYLANILTEQEYNDIELYPYPLESEMKEIIDAYDNLFSLLKTEETEKGIAFYQGAKVPAYVDLTDEFDKVPTFEEIEKHIKDIIASGEVFDTLSPKWKIDIKGGNRVVDKITNQGNFQRLQNSAKKRHNKYVKGIKSLINNAKYSHPDKNTKPKEKPNILRYHYFDVNVKIGDTVYLVSLECEENKNVPQGNYAKRSSKSHWNNKNVNQTNNDVKVVHLYNIREKKKIANVNSFNQDENNKKEQLQRKDGKLIDVEYYDNSDIKEVEPLSIKKLKFENIEDVKNIKHRNIKDLIFNNKNKISIKNNHSEINASLSSRNVDEILNSVFKERNTDKNLYRLKKEMISNIEAIFENAIPVLKHAELKNENLFDKQVIHRFALPIKIGNNNFLTMITVKERTDFKEAKIDEFSIYDLNSQKDEMVARNWQDKNLNHIDNHTYSMNDITNFVNSNLEKYKVTLNQNNYNNDANNTNNRASIEFKEQETIITLAKGNDASSFMHELAHLYLHDLQELAKVNKRAKKDLQEVYDMLGFDSSKDYSEDEFREMHEKFARSFEAYLLNGQAPTEKMKGIFERFKEFLQQIYETLVDLDVEFSNEVKQCFDRLLTTDEEYEKEVLPMYEKNDELADSINQQNTLSYQIKNNLNAVKNSWKSFYDTVIIPFDTRLDRITPELKKILRKHTFDMTMQSKKDCDKITPFLLKIQEIKKNKVTVKINEKEFNAYNLLSYALNNRDSFTANKVIKELGIQKEFSAVRELLDSLHDEAESVGLEVGYLESYYPRMVQSDKTNSFIEMFERMANEEEIDLKEQLLNNDEAQYSNTKRQIKDKDIHGLWSSADKAKLINTSIRGFGKNNIMLSRIGQLKFERLIDKLTPEQQRFYEPIEKALSNYVIGARKNIEERKFFGAENKEVSKLRASIKKKRETLRETKTRTPAQAKWKEINRLKYELAPIEIKLETITGELKNNQEHLKNTKEKEEQEKIKGYISKQKETIKDLQERAERLKSQLQWVEESNQLKVKNVVVKRLNDDIANLNKQINDILGSVDHVEDSIGRLIVDLAEKGIIHVKDEQEVRNILVSRFNSLRIEKFALGVRDVSTMVTLNDITNAVTQITDLTFSAFKFGLFNTIQGMKQVEGLKREDLGINNIAEEFRGTTGLSKWINLQLKIIGLDLIDGFAKNTAINASVISARKKAKTGNKKFDEKLKFLFGEKAEQVKKDLIEGKTTDEIIFIAFNDLADIQPISTDQMTSGYQSGFKPLYILKTYSIKALDILRNECFIKISSGVSQLKTNKTEGVKLISEGLGNIIKLQMFMWLFGLPQDLLKDLIANKEFDIPEHVIDNIIIFGIFNRFLVKKASENPANIYLENIKLPALQAVGDLWTGIEQVKKGKKKVKDLYVWSRVPIVGKMYYSWLGGKKEKRVKL